MALRNRIGKRNKGMQGADSAGAGSGKGTGGDQVAKAITFRQRKAILRMARYSFLKKVIVIAALIFVLFSFVFGFMTIKGEDMAPAVRDGDIVLFFRLGREYNPSDLLVYEHDGKKYIGRVVAASGTSLDKSEKGVLLINGRIHPPQKKNGLFYDTYARSKISYPFTLQQGEYFVLGDRRDDAKDSRDFGPINKDDIKGKVFSIIRKKNI